MEVEGQGGGPVMGRSAHGGVAEKQKTREGVRVVISLQGHASFFPRGVS